MIKIREAIIVEGRYDQNTLRQIVDAPVFRTDGFGIFKNREQLALLRSIAEKRGLIVLTDSDGAGFVIRNHIKCAIPAKYLKHAYIPDISGKEKRKTSAGKEGKLGVEGMPKDVLLDVLRDAGATIEGEVSEHSHGITKQDMVCLGLSGSVQASHRRLVLQKECGLPEHMSANALLQALDLIYSRSELEAICSRLWPKD